MSCVPYIKAYITLTFASARLYCWNRFEGR